MDRRVERANILHETHVKCTILIICLCIVDLGEPARQVARMTGFQVSESSSELSPREYIRNYQIGLARLIVEL